MEQIYMELYEDKLVNKSIIRDKQNNVSLFLSRKKNIRAKILFVLLYIISFISIIAFISTTSSQNRKFKEIFERMLKYESSDNIKLEQVIMELKARNQYLEKKIENIEQNMEQIKKGKTHSENENETKSIKKPLMENQIIVTYDIKLPKGEVLLFNNECINLSFNDYSIKIDGKQVSPMNNHVFNSIGYHKATILLKKELTSLKKMFYDCNNIVEIDLSSLKTMFVKDTSYMFFNCSLLRKLNLDNFNTSLVTDMRYMFYHSNSIKSVDISHFNTSFTKNMECMFYQMRSLQTIDLRHFNTSLVVNMRAMFYELDFLLELNVSSFNTSLVTDMSGMFYKMSSIKSLDVSNFNTSLVQNMYYMFYETNHLSYLDLSNFNTSLVEDMEKMFYKMTSLKSLNIQSFNLQDNINVFNIFGEIPNLGYITIIYDSNKKQRPIINEMKSMWVKKDLKEYNSTFLVK